MCVHYKKCYVKEVNMVLHPHRTHRLIRGGSVALKNLLEMLLYFALFDRFVVLSSHFLMFTQLRLECLQILYLFVTKNVRYKALLNMHS